MTLLDSSRLDTLFSSFQGALDNSKDATMLSLLYSKILLGLKQLATPTLELNWSKWTVLRESWQSRCRKYITQIHWVFYHYLWITVQPGTRLITQYWSTNIQPVFPSQFLGWLNSTAQPVHCPLHVKSKWWHVAVSCSDCKCLACGLHFPCISHVHAT